MGRRSYPGLGVYAVARHRGDPAGLDPERPVAVICAGGVRAGTAASLLRRQGLDQVLHVVDGGVARWEQLGNTLEQS